MKEKYLGIDIKDTSLSCCCYVLYGLKTGAIEIARKLGMFDESALRD